VFCQRALKATRLIATRRSSRSSRSAEGWISDRDDGAAYVDLKGHIVGRLFGLTFGCHLVGAIVSLIALGALAGIRGGSGRHVAPDWLDAISIGAVVGAVLMLALAATAKTCRRRSGFQLH